MLKINNTTWKQEIKTDKKDELSCIIGDDKQADFIPQMKIERWTNECNVSIRLIEDKDEAKETATIIEENGKIKHIKSKRECHFYNIENTEHPEGASEFEIILKEDPRKKKGEDYTLEFSLEDKDVDYFYQPALTPAEIAEGAVRPKNIVGSYAIYAKTPKTNWTGGKEYKRGKVGHIYRPKIIDSIGTEVWGELKIDKGILSVTIPQGFLDNAIYPVRHAAGLTFGYETAGASNLAVGNTLAAGGSIVDTYTASAGDTITGFSFYGYTTYGADGKAAVAAYTFVGGVPSARLAAKVDISVSGTEAWQSVGSLSQALTNGVAYCSAFSGENNVGSAFFRIFYDAGSAPGRIGSTNTTLTDPFGATGTDSGRHYSIYATYTAGGGGEAVKPNHLFSLMGCGN
jgi:hypothetical protein